MPNSTRAPAGCLRRDPRNNRSRQLRIEPHDAVAADREIRRVKHTLVLTKSSTARSTFGRSGSMSVQRRVGTFNVTHYDAREPIVERQRSAEPPASSGSRQDLGPCLAACNWPRGRWSCHPQGRPIQCWPQVSLHCAATSLVALVVVRAPSSPERQGVFVCCGSCSNCSDGELGAKIVAQVTYIRPQTSVATGAAEDLPAPASAPAAVETKADTDEPLMAAARQAPATWVAAAARAWAQLTTRAAQRGTRGSTRSIRTGCLTNSPSMGSSARSPPPPP